MHLENQEKKIGFKLLVQFSLIKHLAFNIFISIEENR